MPVLPNSFTFDLAPAPPYDFRLTVKKPAGWALFTPYEEYGSQTLWTATHVSGNLLGIKLSSSGSVESPSIKVKVFSVLELSEREKAHIRSQLTAALGVEQDLGEFYRFASEDSILKHVIHHLYGMHDTSPISIFPEAVLAILLQMAPLKRSNEMMDSFIREYGEIAEFDRRKIRSWPLPEVMAPVPEGEIAAKCRVGYRAKSISKLAKKLSEEGFPTMNELSSMEAVEARKLLLTLPGIGDYSADIISPHGGFPIDVWSAEVFGMLFFGKKPENNRQAVEIVKKEGLRRWGKWSWMAFFYIVQDLKHLSAELHVDLRIT